MIVNGFVWRKWRNKKSDFAKAKTSYLFDRAAASWRTVEQGG
jgi:hypothetical protein